MEFWIHWKEAKLKRINWSEVTEATEGGLPAGAYVINIVRVKDNPDKEQLEVVFDVAEGEKAGIYKDVKPDEDWKHTFNQKYSENAQGFFKRFLKELERDNANFSIDEWEKQSNENDLAGLKLGMVFGEYRYVNEKGEAKYSMNAVKPISIEDVRNGNFTIPEPRYSQYTDEEEWTDIKNAGSGSSTAATAGQKSVYDDSVPF